MSITFETYWPLLFLTAVPYLWWVRRLSVVDLSGRHLLVSTAVRSAIVALLALALMQPVFYSSGAYLSVLYVLDVSQSVAPSAIQEAMNRIERINEEGRPAHSGFIAFGSNSMAFGSLEEMQRVKVSRREAEASLDQSGTNIANAIDRAIHSFAPHHLKRLVLFTDGNDNAGNLANVLPRLKADNTEVYTFPLETRAGGDVWIEGILAPPTITAGEQFPVEVHVYCQADTVADIAIKDGGKILNTRSVALKSGMNRVAFETTVSGETRTAVLEATAKAAGDSFAENNVFRESAFVSGRPRILYVEGYAPSARYLREALTVEGFLVEVISPASMPAAAPRLEAYDAVILSDVDRKSLSDSQMQALLAYIRDLGGGFILAGGENSYGEGGYSKTAIEEVLPVTFEVKKSEPRSVAMIIVLDRSGSMAGQKMELAKQATMAPLDLLKDTDRFGVVAFEYNFRWVVEPQPVANKAAIRELISAINAVGETNIYPALRDAYMQLIDAPEDVRHVILLSDGQTFPEDFQGLTTQMANSGITVSTVAVGTVADRDLLANIAKWGKGRTYYLEEATNVPQVFSQETQLAKSLREEAFRPVVKKVVEAFKGIDFNAAPQLLGYVATKAKPTSEILLESAAGEPLLARWQYGLGKTAAFTSDVKDRWAAEWIRWKDYPKFWSQLVRETMRRQEDDAFDFRVKRDGEFASVSVNAVQKDGRFRNNMRIQVRVTGPGQDAEVVDLPQVRPGAYETRVPLEPRGAYTFRAFGENSASPLRMLAYSYPDEYHFYPPNLDKLRAISAETGGAFRPDPADIFDPKGQTTAVPMTLWPWLGSLALALYILDVLLRRLRLWV